MEPVVTRIKVGATIALLSGVCASAQAQSLFASTVVNYTPGATSPIAGFDDPLSVLGSPTRFTAPDDPFGGAVTPFNAPFGAGETLTLTEGASITLGFDQTVFDNPDNPFGIDLLVFGNSFLGIDFTTFLATGQVFSEGGVIELSENGSDWFEVVGVDADGWFPTLGYQDVTEPFPASPGSVFTDFNTPVDPTLDVTGMTTAEIAEAYGGSGGGAGIDIGSVGLSAVNFIRISNPVGSGVTPEIDAVAIVVPAPVSALGLGVLGFGRARRRPA